ncbi:MAG: hypothetical protein Q9223_001908 [Gallowayella weberi]
MQEVTIQYALAVPEVRGEDDPRTLQAIEEGRRLYVGNLPYMAKGVDVMDLFERNGYQIEHMNMSTDPYSGRNPSYCFVELTTKSQADNAMRELSGKLVLGRPVKIGPGLAAPKKKSAINRSSRGCYSHTPVFQRWTRTDASDHFEGYGLQGRRVRGIRELFAGFEIEVVSKVVIKAGNQRHLFVDFPSAEEARRAAKATDGRYAWNVKISVQVARWADSPKVYEREKWCEENSDLKTLELPDKRSNQPI